MKWWLQFYHFLQLDMNTETLEHLKRRYIDVMDTYTGWLHLKLVEIAQEAKETVENEEGKKSYVLYNGRWDQIKQTIPPYLIPSKIREEPLISSKRFPSGGKAQKWIRCS